MRPRTHPFWHAVAAAGLALTLGVAPAGSIQPAPEPDLAAIREQIQRLQARIVELDSRQARLDDAAVEQTVRRVLDDAEEQTQLLAAEGFTAGWDKGFVIRSADGNFVFKPGLVFQFRNITNYRQDAPGGGDQTESGFDIRRVRFIFSGNAFTPNLTYQFMWENGSVGGKSTLQDAYVAYKFNKSWGFKVGQYTDPASHEFLIAPARRLAVETSLVDFYLGGGQEDRVQGVSLLYGMSGADTPINAELAFHDGVKSKNTDFQDSPTGGHYGAALRVEAKAFGDWSSYRDFTTIGHKSDLLVFGAAADFTEFDNLQQVLATADAKWKTGRLGLYGALLARVREPRNVPEDDTLFDYGGLAQAAWLFTDRWEVFGRYSYTHFDQLPAGNREEDSVHELCGGVNWYIDPSAPHRARMTIDVTYLPVGAVPAKNFGVLGGTDDAEIVVRGQFQLFL